MSGHHVLHTATCPELAPRDTQACAMTAKLVTDELLGVSAEA